MPAESQANPFLSLVIPAHNEEESIRRTCSAIISRFGEVGISDYEILVVNDGSRDGTEAVLKELAQEHPRLRYVNNAPPNGFGLAVRCGLREYRGECVAVVMADLSDAPDDILAYYRKLKEGAECVFGSRFIRGSRIYDYPPHKLILNRMANFFIRVLFRLGYNDITNAFKAYRRTVIDGIQPLFSKHFNLTVEMPLKAVVRGYSFVTLPISWTNRTGGTSKLKIKEMGSRYLFIVLYCWLEKKLSRRDYMREP